MQSLEEIEEWYSKEDPWGYRHSEDDKSRKERILAHLTKPYKRALDIGCGEGWITRDLPAEEIEGYEISDNASKRLPGAVKRVTEPSGKYDLIVATGVLYRHYNSEYFIDLILKHASGTVLLSNISEWEVDTSKLGTPIYEEEYPYREFNQRLKIYDFSLP